MKRLSLFALAFFFIAAPIYMKYETRGLTINGKSNPFGQAQLVNGVWAIPLSDFAKAFGGGGTTLEGSGLQIRGNSLVTLASNSMSADKHKMGDGSLVPAVEPIKKNEVKTNSPGSFFVRKAGATISGNLLTFNGAKFVPVADVARAFGGTFTAPAGNLAPGQALTLNFAVNGNSTLGFNH
jgi:hypothetical protein